MTYRPPHIPSRDITPQQTYLRRRELLAAGAGLVLAGSSSRAAPLVADGQVPKPLAVGKRTNLAGDETATTLSDATSYNNFYEFGTDKSDPKANAGNFRTRPWTVVLEGECNKPQTLGIDDILKAFPLEERVYRFRCVEAWSMVIPWVGFPLADLIKRMEPTGNAKYVALTTLHDPKQMPGQRRSFLDWPYVEGLRMDEAMHPLTLLAVGLYGQVLPNQNGAPIRLVVPWKYGFKSIKSIVKIRLQEERPVTTWNTMASTEYGFYSNVNPGVDHPRWSQAKERRIGDFLKRKTLMFNGYPEVASLYSGMDLARNF
jgi:sulfoxide reductase catalytic subunit YedY